MRFRYLRDPLFLACALAYVVNRFVLKLLWQDGFLRDHLNDLICVPFLVPIMLYAQRKLGLRRHDAVPQPFEILIPLIVWAMLFEVVLPNSSRWDGIAVADYNDVLCYALGAFLASITWLCWYRDKGGSVCTRSKDRNGQEEDDKIKDHVGVPT